MIEHRRRTTCLRSHSACELHVYISALTPTTCAGMEAGPAVCPCERMESAGNRHTRVTPNTHTHTHPIYSVGCHFGTSFVFNPLSFIRNTRTRMKMKCWANLRSMQHVSMVHENVRASSKMYQRSNKQQYQTYTQHTTHMHATRMPCYISKRHKWQWIMSAKKLLHVLFDCFKLNLLHSRRNSPKEMLDTHKR